MRWAARHGHDDIVARLLDAGVDGRDAGDSLVLAATNGHDDAVDARLLAAGANVSADDFRALRAAKRKGHDAVVALLLQGAMRGVKRKSGTASD